MILDTADDGGGKGEPGKGRAKLCAGSAFGNANPECNANPEHPLRRLLEGAV